MMEKIWKRIEAWLAENAPETLQDLNPAAAAADFAKAERAFSARLPATLKESYAVHDGQRGGSAPLFGEYMLLSLAAMIKEWKNLKKLANGGVFNGMYGKPAPQVRPDWWNPRWIPVASNSSGDFICVDLAPTRGGKSGQLISFLHVDPARALVAKDFKLWLSGFAKDLESGKYKVDRHGWLTKSK